MVKDMGIVNKSRDNFKDASDGKDPTQANVSKR